MHLVPFLILLFLSCIILSTIAESCEKEKPYYSEKQFLEDREQIRKEAWDAQREQFDREVVKEYYGD